MLMGLLTLTGCAQRPDPPDIVPVSETEATVEPIEPDDPEVVRSVERMLAVDSTEALKWVEAHQPAWTPAINRIYGMGVRKIVIHEYDEEFIGRVPKALIVDRGDVSVEPVQQALLDWQGEHTVLDHGWTTTSQYTVVFLY